MRYTARDRLKQRLIALNGGTSGYLHRVRAFMAESHRDAELPSINFLWQAIHAYKIPAYRRKRTPVWQVVEFVRYCERKPEMEYFEALERAGDYFTIETGDEDAA
jgi:hypothetical protein